MPKFFASRTFYECVWVSSLDHKWHSAGFLSLGVLGRVRLLKRLQSLIKLSYGVVVMWGHNIRRWTLTSQGCIMSQHTETNQGIAPLTHEQSCSTSHRCESPSKLSSPGQVRSGLPVFSLPSRIRLELILPLKPRDFLVWLLPNRLWDLQGYIASPHCRNYSIDTYISGKYFCLSCTRSFKQRRVNASKL